MVNTSKLSLKTHLKFPKNAKQNDPIFIPQTRILLAIIWYDKNNSGKCWSLPEGMLVSSVVISQKYFLEAENIMLSGQQHRRYASGSSFIIRLCFQTLKNFFFTLFYFNF